MLVNCSKCIDVIYAIHLIFLHNMLSEYLYGNYSFYINLKAFEQNNV